MSVTTKRGISVGVIVLLALNAFLCVRDVQRQQSRPGKLHLGRQIAIVADINSRQRVYPAFTQLQGYKGVLVFPFIDRLFQ